jgi:hypothetical protein
VHPEEARLRPFLLHQDRRVDTARRIVERDHRSYSRLSPTSQRWREPSWNSSMPGSGRRGRFLRCADRRLAFFTSPAACKASRVTV